MAWLKVSLSPVSGAGATTGGLDRLAAGVLAFLASVRFAGGAVRVFFAAFLAFGFFMGCHSTSVERAAQVWSGPRQLSSCVRSGSPQGEKFPLARAWQSAKRS